MKLDDGWYREQPCTTFHTLEHRKERKGFKHEFIVLRLLDDSVCRIERMGDPDARFDAISPRGSVAHDMAQCFRPDELDQACLDTSDIISTITLPFDCNLKDVLKICRAVQEGEKTRNYTLQVYNCYFFSLAIQACLTRTVARWEDEVSLKAWLSQVDESVAELPHTLQSRIESPSSQPTILELCSTLFPDPSSRNLISLIKEIRSGVQDRLANDPGSVYREISSRINDMLWYSTISSGLNQFVQEKIKEVIGKIIKDRIDRLLIIPDAHANNLNKAVIKTELYLVLVDLLALGATIPSIGNSSRHRLSESKNVRTKPLEKGVRSITSTSLLDFKGNPTRQDESQNSLADWCRWIVKCLLYLILWLLEATLDLLGVTHLTPKIHFIPSVSIEDELKKALTKLEFSKSATYSGLEQFVNDLRLLLKDEAAIWYRNPWTETCSCVIQHVPFDMLAESEELGPTIQSCLKGQHVTEDLSIAAFQRHILNRIKLQAEEVQGVWLGSAVIIETELKGMLSEVWKMIREDDGLDITKEFKSPIANTSITPTLFYDLIAPKPGVDRKSFPATDLIYKLLHHAAADVSAFRRNCQISYRLIEYARDLYDAINLGLLKAGESGIWAHNDAYYHVIDSLEEVLLAIMEVAEIERDQYLLNFPAPALNEPINTWITGSISEWQTNRAKIREGFQELRTREELRGLIRSPDDENQIEDAKVHDDGTLLQNLLREIGDNESKIARGKPQNAEMIKKVKDNLRSALDYLRGTPEETLGEDLGVLAIKFGMIIYGITEIMKKDEIKQHPEVYDRLYGTTIWKAAQRQVLATDIHDHLKENDSAPNLARLNQLYGELEAVLMSQL